METDRLTDIQIATQVNPAVVQKHLLLNNQQTLWDFSEQITVWQI